MTVWRSLAHVAQPHDALAEAVVAWRGGRPVTHAQFVREVQRWCATWLTVDGPEVALYFDDSLSFAAALFGAWHAGKTAVLAADRQPGTLQRLMSLGAACAGLLPGAQVPVQVAPQMLPVLHALPLHETRLIVFTSGSSGEPTRIVKCLAQLDAEVHSLQALFGAQIDCESPATVLATVSHQHIYGLLFRVLWPLAALRPFVVEQLSYPEEIVERLREGSSESGAILVSSPAILLRLPDALGWASTRDTLRGVFSSGGPLSVEASRHTRELTGHSPVEVFGSSETGGIAWRRRAEHGDAWQPMHGVQWCVKDGLLVVRSPHLEDSDVWWTTSDKVEPVKDASGQCSGFILKGRADRIVKIAEKRVSLTALEAALLSSDLLQEVKAVLLSGTALGGEMNEAETHALPRIGVVTQPNTSGWQLLKEQGRKAFNDTLRNLLEQHVERVALPRQWRHVEQMPLTAQGKTTQEQLAKLFRPVMPSVQWLERDAMHARGVLDVRGDLLVFDGHFPQTSLVPGVSQLHWVTILAQQCFAVPLYLRRADALKFQRPILPNSKVVITMLWSADKSTLQFSLTSEAGVHAGGRLVY